MTPREQQFAVGQELVNGRFRIDSLIGEGSIGQVYRAEDRFLEQDVALKTMIRIMPEYILSLKNEFRMLAGISHTNLVQFYELFANESPAFMTMELLTGRNLLEFIWDGTEFPGFTPELEARLANCFIQLTNGIRALHKAGKIHRDIKPSNTMVLPDERLVILDFGLATTAYNDESKTAGVGTPRFWAPEQLSGSPMPASDWFSVGVTLYYALSGLLVPQEVYTTADASYEFLDVVDEKYHDVFTALLAHDPTRRGTGEQLITVLNQLVTTQYSTSQYIAGVAPTVFVGRSDELQLLNHAFETSSDQVRLVQVYGESGIGKSELLRHFVTELHDQRAIVLQGVCRQNESVEYRALDPIVDELARYLKSLPPDEALMLVPRFCDSLLQLFPVLASVRALARAQTQAQDMDANLHRQRAIEGLREILLKLSDRRPLVLWIDDAQWGDEDSAHVLSQLIAGSNPPPILILISGRPEVRQSKFSIDLIARVVELSLPYQEIDIRPLGAAAITELVESTLPEGNPEVIKGIVSTANGSPFLAGELARLMRVHADADFYPTTLQEIVALRMSELSERGRELVALVAIAGHPIDTQQALSIVEHPDHALVYELCNQKWLSRSADDWQSLTCYHQQISDAVESLVGDRKELLHRRIADALAEEADPDWARITEHYLKCHANDQVLDSAAKAAQQAMEKFAFHQAAGFFKLIANADPSAENLRNWATALQAAGHSNAAGDVLMQAAERMDNPADVPPIRMAATAEYLKGGQIALARKIMVDLLPTMGITFPEPGLPSMLHSASRRLLLMIRHLRGDFLPHLQRIERPATPVAEIEAMQDLADFMGPLDSSIADVIMVRVLKLVIERGSLTQIRRRLVLDVSRQMLIGPPFSYMAPRILKNALVLSRQIPTSPIEQTTVYLSLAAYHEWLGHPPECRVAWLRRGERALSEIHGGVDWINVHIDWTMFIPLFAMCQFEEIRTRFVEGFDNARQRGDLLAMSNYMTIGGHYALLTEDRPEYGNQQIQQTVDQLDTTVYLIQHLYAAISKVNNYLYLEDWQSALVCAQDDYDKVKQAGYFRLGILGDRFRLAYARAAARAAYNLRDGGDHNGLDAQQLCRIVESEKKKLTRTIPANKGHHFVFDAALALVKNDNDAAIKALLKAIEQFQNTGEQCLSWCARIRLAEYSSSATHRSLGEEAQGVLQEAGVKKPLQFAAAMLAL